MMNQSMLTTWALYHGYDVQSASERLNSLGKKATVTVRDSDMSLACKRVQTKFNDYRINHTDLLENYVDLING